MHGSEDNPVDEFDTMIVACTEAAVRVNRCGSAELKAAMRVLLFTLGKDVAARLVAFPLDESLGKNGNGQA